MLHFISPHLAISYFLLAFVTIVGVLQFVAARHRLVGLSLVISGRGRRSAYEGRRSAWGYVLAAVLVVGGFAWFFAATPEVFDPGLAGAELAFLFGIAGVCALVFTLLASSILLKAAQRQDSPPPQDGGRRYGWVQEAVSWQELRGTLYLPEHGASLEDEVKPAVCVLPDPSEGAVSPHPLVADLVEAGFIVLAVDWGSENEVGYPAVLGLLPSAVAYLTRRCRQAKLALNPQRIGVLGIDLGGDLALRSAGTDPQIAAVLALAPFLVPANTRPGLSILKEMSYLEAIRWARPLRRKRGELVAKLASLDSIPKLGERPLLLVYGDQDGVIPAERVRAVLDEELGQGKLKALPGEGHLSLPRSPAASALAARWFKENL